MWSLKMCICCHTLAPCLHQPIATTTESANPAAAPRRMTTKDKKTELMVLTSTSHVAPHVAGCSSSIVINLTQVELQMVLISTVSTFFLSFLSSSFSCEEGRQEGVQDTGRAAQLRATHRRMPTEPVHLPTLSAAHALCHGEHLLRLHHDHLHRVLATDATPASTKCNVNFLKMSAIFRATPQEPSKQCLGHCCEALSRIHKRVAS